MQKYFTIIIEDISEGSENGYSITLPSLHNSVVLGENYDELAQGIEMTFEAENKKCPAAVLKTLKRQLGFCEKKRNLSVS